MFLYPANVIRDSNGLLLVTLPDLAEVAAVGEEQSEARRQAVPLPSPIKGRKTVPLSSLAAAKVLLYRAMREQNVRKAELARRLGARPAIVDRLLDIAHASRLDQLDAALAALGKRLDVKIRNAA